ncbi:MAG: phosphoribosylglycinamide formyltransferase [Deltaproteobacteria bacterium]|nr:phosphoribosylglycinamide formyltransferase [Deltaproteobacteria bacterium]
MPDRPIERAPCNADSPLRLGVLVSGSGAVLQLLIDGIAQSAAPATIEVVIGNRKEALALERARSAGLTTRVVPREAFDSDDAYETALLEALQTRDVEVVCLLDYDTLLGPILLQPFKLRLLNLHLSLLPAFASDGPVRQAVEHGARIAGCTLYFVDENRLTGPILLQSALYVWPEDSEESLAVRLGLLGGRLYLRGLRLLAEGRVSVEGRRVAIANAGKPDQCLEYAAADPP